MSDQGRQSLTGKATAALKPEERKSIPEQVGDEVKGKLDSIASKVQPESQKSAGQQVSDSISTSHGGDTSLLSRVKDAVGSEKN